MKGHLFVAVLLGLAVVVISSPALLAQDCNHAPNSWGGANAKAYGEWCGACGGTFSMSNGNPSCTRGPNWGRRPGSTAQPSDNSAAIAAAEAERQRQQEAERQRVEAERQRQQEIEAQRKRDEEEAKRKQEEFERKKQEALSSMKGIAEGELGLKGADAGDLGLKDVGDTGGGGLGLKDAPNSLASPSTTTEKKPDCQWGDLDSSVVDLRCLGLDPDKPIVLDPHVVRGQERVFPAQIDPATFQNANYNRGFEALMRRTFSVQDAMDAVAYFKAAQLQRPDDPLVRNGLLLAQDILKARQQKVQEDKDRAQQSLYHGMAALMMGDVKTASDSVKRASELDPTNKDVADWSMTMAAMSANFRSPGRDIKTVEMLVGNALLSEAWGNYATEVREMEMAKSLAPGDKYVAVILDHARYLASEFPVHNAMHPAPQ